MDSLLWSVFLIGGFMLGELSVVLFLNWRDCGDAFGRERRQRVATRTGVPPFVSQVPSTMDVDSLREAYKKGYLTLNEARGLL